jgi:hypothetical protein
MHILYDFVCYDLFHILLSCDKIMDPWNVYMYVCMYVYTKLSTGTEEDHKRLVEIIGIPAKIRTAYYSTASKKTLHRKSTYQEFFTVALSPYSKGHDSTSNLDTAASFHNISSSLFTTYSVVQYNMTWSYIASLNLS